VSAVHVVVLAIVLVVLVVVLAESMDAVGVSGQSMVVCSRWDVAVAVVKAAKTWYKDGARTVTATVTVQTTVQNIRHTHLHLEFLYQRASPMHSKRPLSDLRRWSDDARNGLVDVRACTPASSAAPQPTLSAASGTIGSGLKDEAREAFSDLGSAWRRVYEGHEGPEHRIMVTAVAGVTAERSFCMSLTALEI